MPTARPMPMMGPMSGDMSMAPMMTAVELTLRPSEAMNMANTSTHRVAPRNDTPALMARTVSASSSLSGMALKYLRNVAMAACKKRLASTANCCSSLLLSISLLHFVVMGSANRSRHIRQIYTIICKAMPHLCYLLATGIDLRLKQAAP